MRLQQRNIRGDEPNTETFDFIPKDPLSGMPLTDEEGSVIFRVRPMGRSEYNAIVKKAEKPVIDPRSRSVVYEVDQAAVHEDVVRRILLGWNENYVDVEGQPIPCNDQTKTMVDGRFLDQVKIAAMGAEVLGSASFR
jgi:hypothetical protein